MTTKCKWLLLSFWVVIFLTSCSKKNPTNNSTLLADYYPLSVGSWWRYTSTFLGSSIDSVESVIAFPDGASGFTVTEKKLGDTITSYYQKRRDEIRRYVFLSDTIYQVLLRFPLQVGKKWQVVKNYGFVVYDSASIIGCGDITLVSGTFKNCYQIKRKWQPVLEDIDSGYFWYAPSIGLILRASSSDSTQLVSYSIH